MKRIFIVLTGLFLSLSIFAQSPEKMSYQAVIRNSSDQLITNQAIGMQISILQGSASGLAVYVETQTPTTNANGLVSIEIGAGTTSDDFSAIDWENGPYFIKTETDTAGGTNYTITGTSQLLSVPYAMHAKTSETVTGGITETDPVYGTSVSSGITATDTTNWNNKQNQLTAGSGIDITNDVISTDIDFILPAGMIIPFAGDTSNIPNGWLLCDGSEVNRTTYARLFASIDTIWGIGDGNITFNLPDFRGTFMRGTDLGKGNDSDAPGRTATNGGNSGDKVGSEQADAFQGHRHTHSVHSNAGALPGSGARYFHPEYVCAPSFTSGAVENSSGIPRTSFETRPKNKNVHYLIKY